MPQVFGWSEDEFDDRARGLAALIRRVWRAIARQVAAQAEKQATVSMAVASPIPAQWTQAVDGEIVGYVRDMYLDAAGNISDTLNAPDELLIGDDLVEVYTNAARNRLVGIGNDVWKNVQAQITLGNQSGESIPEIAARIRNVAGVTEARSLTIARTEVHAAFESGSYEQALFVDPKGEKVWLSTEDERTRPSHRAADGQRVKIGESFNVGGAKLRYPGDPLGNAENCVNCRCSVAYDFDMITIMEEPELEPAMVAAGEQMWKAHQHPRGNDGKFIKSGIVADFLKKSKPNIIDVTKAVGNLDSAQWGKLTDAQKTHIKESVDKLPKGTVTHDLAQKTLDSIEKTAAATDTPPKPKTKIGATYEKLKDAKDGDVLATGTKYNSAGVAQKFKITADKSHVHPDYMPHGKMKLEFLKKNGEPSGQVVKGGILSISQKLHPLPAKGKKPGKVEWDEPGEADAPEVNVPDFAPNPPKPGPKPVTPTGAKIPAGLKGKPGDPAKITTGVVWGKHPADTTVVEDEWGLLRVQWDGKKYNLQSKQEDGSWNTDATMTKKQFYDQHKGDGTGWVIPGAAKTDDGFSTDAESGQLLDEVLGPETSEPPQTPSTPPVSTTSAPDWTKAQDFSGFTKVGGQAGSNPGGKYKSPNGDEWYLKKPKSAQHAANEMAASAFYNLAGIDAPQVTKGAGAPELGNPQTGTKIVPGAKANLGSKLQDEAYIKQLQAGFAMDAWLANWDVAGMGYDNVVEGADGKPHRIDVGGAMLYRAQGEPKGSAFGDTVTELDSLRDGTNPQSAAIFGSMTDEDIRKSAAKLEAISDADIDKIVADAGLSATVAETLKARRQDILSKYPPIKDGYDKDKLLKQYEKGLLTWDDYVDMTGEPPPETDAAPLPGYDIVKLQAQYDKGLITEQDFYDATGQLPKTSESPPEPLSTPSVTTPSGTTGPVITGETLSLKQLHDLIAKAKQQGKYTDGQVIATSPDGSKQLVWSSLDHKYAIKSIDGNLEHLKLLNDIKAIQTIRKENWQVPQDLIPGGVGLIPLIAPSYDGPAIPDDVDLTQFGAPNTPSKSMLLNDLQSGMLSVDESVILAKQLDATDFFTMTSAQITKLDATLDAAKNLSMPGGASAHRHWASVKQKALNEPDPNAPGTSTSVDAPDTSKVATSASGALYYLDANEQTKMVSSDGKFVLEQVNSPMGKYSLETKQDDGTSVFAYINDADDVDYTTGQTASLWYPAKTLEVPESNDPVVDTETIGVTNSGALFALQNGDAEELVTIDGKYTVRMSMTGDEYVLLEHHDGGTSTATLFGNDTDLEGFAGLQVWYPQKEIDQSTNAPDAAANVSGTPVDLDIVNEKIDLNEYTSGEVIGVSADGQYRLVYSAFLNGLIYQHKIGNTGDDDLDWDALGTFDDNGEGAVAQFKDAYPSDEFFEPTAQPSANGDPDVTNWDPILSGPYVYNDVVAEAGDNGKWQLVDKDNDEYGLYKKDNATSQYNLVGMHSIEDLYDLTLPDDASWNKVNAGTKFKSGKIPPKKAFAKKVAKAAGVPSPGAYTPAMVSPGEKKFYLEDAEGDTLVPAEAIHLLNGAGGLNSDDVKKLTPKQIVSIDKQIKKALDNGAAGSGAASLQWSDLKKDIPSQATNIADQSYFMDMEDEMWAGSYHTADVFAVSPDGKQRLVFHSTDGPMENPNAFALETNGPLGWETTKIYTNGYGGPSGQLTADTMTMGKTWLIPGKDSPDLNADFDMPPVPGGNDAGVTATFNPPGDGTKLPGTIFDMKDWAPEGKVILVGKDEDDAGYTMIITKNADGEKVIEISAFNPATGNFQPMAHLANEQEYNLWDDVNVKWDAPNILADQSVLANVPNTNAPDAATPSATPSVATPSTPTEMLDLKYSYGPAIWSAIQNLPDGTLIGHAKDFGGNDIQMRVKSHFDGGKYLVLESKNPGTGNWQDAYNITGVSSLQDDLTDYNWTSSLPLPSSPAPSSPAPSAPLAALPALVPSNLNAIWDHVQTMNVGDVYAHSKNGEFRLVVAGGPPNDKYLIIESEKADGSGWDFYTAPGTTKTKLLGHLNLQTAPHSMKWQLTGPVATPASVPTPAAPVVPTPAVPSGPPAPKLIPINKITDAKFHLKNSGNLGYYSKPENIWAAIKEWQAKPGNEQYSPMDIFKSLDHTLKTAKPNPFQDKMVKWASTKKGAQTIGTDGIYGSTPTAPTTPTAPDFKPENVDAIWAHIQTLPVGTVIADGENTWNDHSRMVVKGTVEKYIEVQAKNYNDEWTYSHAATHKSSLVSDLSSTNWKWETTDEYKGTATPAASPLAGIALLAGVDFSPGTVNGNKDSAAKIWSALDSLPDGTILAHVTSPTGVDKQMYVATAPNGTKIIHVKAFDPASAQWEGYGSYTSVGHLAGGLVHKWKPGPNGSVGTPLGAPAKMPDIEAGNDISGIDDAKQLDVYTKFKAESFTYLSSPEHSIFDAIQAVAKAEGLTLGQVLNIVDEQGAKKVSKPNDGLFKKKLAAWVKTPEAAAHILNEPTVVTGLPTPPDYLPQYDPQSTLPSFEESSKYQYDYVKTIGEAQKIWDEMTAKTEPISVGQKSALKTWTGGVYDTINGFLYEPNKPPLSSTHKGAMNGSQKGMRPSDRPMVLVRGTGFAGLGNAKNHAQLEKMVGTTWRNNAFAATSVASAKGDQSGVHSPAFSYMPLWIEFECPPGTPMAWLDPFSQVKGEREMLLGANLHYKIIGVEKKNIPGHGMKSVARVRIVPKPEGAA